MYRGGNGVLDYDAFMTIYDQDMKILVPAAKTQPGQWTTASMRCWQAVCPLEPVSRCRKARRFRVMKGVN